jgi:hypothetical protein
MQIFQLGRLWIADLNTAFGHVELLCGEGGEPDLETLVLVERFLEGPADHLAAVRRSAFRLPFLWRPIRLAVNDQGRLGLQFRHRVTGRQAGMFFADEHSSFTTRLSAIAVTEEDRRRLEAHT